MLIWISSRQTSATLQRLVSLVQSDAAKFEDLHQSVRQLGQGVTASGLSEDAQSQIASLLALPERISVAIGQHRLLRALAFDDMYGRHDAIEHAQMETFIWLISKDLQDRESLVNKTEAESFWGHEKSLRETTRKRQEARERFTTWLRHGSGVFHISGKLGSGKSTLMKYLGDNAKDSEYLKLWAGKRRSSFAVAPPVLRLTWSS